MSVQNLRNKFSQNNGTVPFKPPGLSFGNTLTVNNHNSGTVVNGGKRFKTIREELDGGTEDVLPQQATRNSSFLQNYMANDMAVSCKPTTQVPVKVQASQANSAIKLPSALDISSKFKNSVSSPPIVHHLPKSNVSAATMPVKLMSKFSTGQNSLPTKSQDYSLPGKFLTTENEMKQTVTVDGKWKVKFDETETKRKGLLIQSQKCK